MTGSVLVSPLGLRPGALYSAIVTARPASLSRCLVICSLQTEPSIALASRAADYRGEMVAVVLDDPFPSPREIERRAVGVAPLLHGATQIFVNITGGTTLMGVLAERIAHQGRRLGIPVRRFAVVDRRAQAEQEADPFQPGEAYWLDEDEFDEEVQ